MWSDALSIIPKHPDLDDQSIFWIAIRSSTNPPIIPLPKCIPYTNRTYTPDALVTCPLDGCVFSAGALRGVAYTMLRDGLKKRGKKAYTIHANYIKGNERKQNAFQIHGYWLATKMKDNSWNGVCNILNSKWNL
jgi:hypothetical protein